MINKAQQFYYAMRYAIRYGQWNLGYDKYRRWNSIEFVDCYYDGFIKVLYIGKFFVEVVY